MKVWTILLPGLILLGSCSSPPKPPTVDESRKRPVNSQAAVELQVCRTDLQNTRILAAESGRLAESTSAAIASIAAQQRMLVALKESRTQEPEEASARPAAQAYAANTVYSVRFDFGSTSVSIPTDLAQTLVAEAKASPLVLLRGRTDGAVENSAESRIARERAGAVRDYLVAAGVDPARIRATYQPTGDPVADNQSPSGRGLNRRVEIEVYRTLPVVLGTTAVARH